MKKYILCIILLLCTVSTFGAWRLPITNFSVKDLEAGRQNWKIAEGKNGWIYFANNNGLLEYNGLKWQLHQIDNGSIVRAVEVAQNGNIYVGALNEFGVFAPDEQGRLTYTNLDSKLDTNNDLASEVWDILATTNKVHFRARREVITIDQQNQIEVKPGKGLALASCIMDNNAYIATSEGLFVVTDGAQFCINSDDSIPFDQISAMTSFDDNKILISTSLNGLYLFENGKITRFETPADHIITQHQLFSIAANKDYIACGTVSRGVVIIDRNKASFDIYDSHSGLQNNTILSLMFDSANRLWCGLDNGISYIDTDSPLHHYSTESGSHFAGYCTYIDSDYIYMGTNQGLLRSERVKIGEMQNYNAPANQFVENSEGQVWSINTIDNQIFCSHTRGLFRLESHGSEASLRPVYTDDGVWGFTQIDERRYLVGTYEGILLMQFTSNNNNTISRIKGYTNSAQKILLHAPSNSAFILDANGLERVKFSADFTSASGEQMILNNSSEVKILELNDQIVIYSPQQIYFVDNFGDLQPTTKYDKLLDINQSYLFLETDNSQNIWQINHGKLQLLRFNAESKSYEESPKLFYEDRHLFIPRFTSIAAIDERHYIINNIYGYSIIDTHSQKQITSSEKPIVVGIYDTSNRDSLLLSEAYSDKHKLIKLPYEQNSIRIVYGCKNAIDQSLQYSYRLKGLDQEWSEWSGSLLDKHSTPYNQKEYTNLREGNYTFEIRLRNTEGEIKHNSLDIVVLPPWQRSTPMYLLYFAATLIAVLYSRRRIISHFENRRRLLEVENAQKIEAQKREYLSKSIEQENNIMRLENERLESEVILKSAKLSNLLLNKLEKTDIINEVRTNLEKIRVDVVSDRRDSATKRISTLARHLNEKMIDNVDWSAFEKNFDTINNNFTQKIQERYNWMTLNERKLCIYIKMGLQNKEIAPLLNLSVRGVEMLRYRVRKKMKLDRNISLYDLLQNI